MEKKKKGKRKKKEKGNEEGAQRTRDKCLPELVYPFVFRKRFALAKMFARGSLKYLECFEEAGERILPLPLPFRDLSPGKEHIRPARFACSRHFFFPKFPDRANNGVFYSGVKLKKTSLERPRLEP